MNIYNINLLILFSKLKALKSDCEPQNSHCLFDKQMKLKLERAKKKYEKKNKRMKNTYLESNLVQSSGDHKYKCQSLSRMYLVPNTQVNIDKLVDRRCYNHHSAIQLCLRMRIARV